ncbi:hypothetical protein ONZ45_g7002 [Pleurotus djamor]|nr:hypothetical protein ONZ45_g7002 [Pleurotus djamor]
MPAKSSSFVDPSSISLPSPSPEPTSATTSTSNLQSASASSSSAQPSRKRPRTEVSSEERKEARAHRNRIAAQNSRDRRKAQFHHLEQRVHELEEENRLLRASIGLASISASAHNNPPPPKQPTAEELREKENQELKERIRTLERGWDAVVKALAAQGLPTGIPLSGLEASTSTPNTQTTSLPTPVSLTPPSSSAAKSASPAPSTDSTASPASQNKLKQDAITFPTMKPAPIGFPLSPAPSDSSLDSFDIDMELDISSSTSSSLFAPSEFKTPTIVPVPNESSQTSHEQHLSTRHLARVATTAVEAVSLQRTYDAFGASNEPEVDDATMETLFREILAASPSLPSKSLPDTVEGGAVSGLPASTSEVTLPDLLAGAGAGGSEGLVGSTLVGLSESTGLLNAPEVDVGTSVMATALYDWAADAEMKKLLDMLPGMEGVGDVASWDPSMLSAVNTIGV